MIRSCAHSPIGTELGPGRQFAGPRGARGLQSTEARRTAATIDEGGDYSGYRGALMHLPAAPREGSFPSSGTPPPTAGAGARAHWCAVVLSWNGREDTLRCLESLQRVDSADLEVVCLDNGS